MNYQLLDHLAAMRDTIKLASRRCAGDFERQRYLYHEWLHYTRRIENEWRRSEGTPRTAGREGIDRGRAA
jgi:hypothetical protein